MQRQDFYKIKRNSVSLKTAHMLKEQFTLISYQNKLKHSFFPIWEIIKINKGRKIQNFLKDWLV